MKKLLSAAIAAATLGLSAGVASASTISVDTSASGIFGNDLKAQVSFDDATIGTGTVQAGMFHLTGTPGLGEFVAFCVELTQRLQNPQDYNINPNLFSASKAADISKLFGSALMGGKMETVFDTAAEAAGFQIALWEVVYETGSSYDMASGSFKAWGFDNNAALSAAVNDKAKDYLDGMANAPMPVLLFLENDDYQDLVTVVPLPAAGFLLAFGLAGLGLAGRRKKA